jgi:peptide/nickel transport system substrate-binding protein
MICGIFMLRHSNEEKDMYKKLLLGLTFGMMAYAITACRPRTDSGATGTAANSAAMAETLTIAITKDENTLSPFTYVSSTGIVVNRLIYDTLFTADLNNEIVPWMVEDEYKVENDFSSYTFTLLDGQKFHDGKPVTAQDIVFSFTYPRDQNVSSQRRIANQIDTIKIIDEKTITITLKSPDINFLRSGLASMRIISKAQYEHEPTGSAVLETIGSGMYRLREYKTGEYYSMEAVEDYFRGAPKVKRINMPIMENNAVVQQGLLSGDLAATTSNIGVELLDTFNQAEHIGIFSSQGYSPMMMNINNGRPLLDSREFRLALSYGINVAGIMEALYGKYATVGTKGIIRPDEPYSMAGLDYVYDPDRAQEILDSAGFDRKNARGIRLGPAGEVCSFEILVYSSNAIRIRAAELIAEQLKALGIELTVKAMEMDTVDAFVWPDFEVSRGRDYDFSMWGWGTSINPDFLAGLFSSDFDIGTSNVCGYYNAVFDEKVKGGYLEVRTSEDLTAVLRDLQTIVAQDPGLICFGFADSLQAANIKMYSGWKTGKGANLINIYSFLGD